MRHHFLVETEWLAEHLQDPDVRVVDIRGYVRTVQRDGVQQALYVGAPDDYAQAHIPGAVYIDWTRDIVDLDDPVEAQIAPPEQFARVLSGLGIGDRHLVVAYDSHPASQFATRLWWALRYYGHNDVVVLNGGLPRWQRENRPLCADLPTYAPAPFTPVVQPALRASAQDVLAALAQPGTRLIDAREFAQYTGATARAHGRAGHIPGAINIPREELIASDGTFRSEEELRQIFADRQVEPGEHIIAYCNGGVAATTVLFSLALLGYPSLTNYDGSWNEWGARADLPAEA
ncbi:MAG TPA: sulfurtransferase [Ktedonobacteraceae bacterium]|jgi:thiosulfate/3-mercaptopyruvate sulfurtransferase